MVRNYINELKGILATGSFSQRDLAGRLGVTFAALNRWLNRRATPHPRHIQTIHKLYLEIVGYPAISGRKLEDIIRHAKSFKKKRLWGIIAKHQPLLDELLLEHTYNSTSIEGTTFTKKETEAVLFDKSVIPEKSLAEHLEVTNHAAVLRELFQKKYPRSITEEFIKRMHRNLMQGLREDAGEYSKHQRAIRGVDIALTHPKDIPEEMAHLIKNWNQGVSSKTIKEIANFHVRFELIHPFGDGNGRLGRLLMTFQCLEADYSPVVIENSRKAEYYEALEYAQRKSEGPFIAFLADEMERTHKIIKRYLIAAGL